MRRHKAVLPLLLLSIGLQVLWPVEAQARTAYNGACDDGEMCLWMHTNHQGCVYDGWSEGDFRKVHYTSCRDKVLNDSVSSYKNLSDDWLLLSEHPDGKGARYCIGPRRIGNIQPGFNDKASSSGDVPGDDVQMEQVRKSCRYVDAN